MLFEMSVAQLLSFIEVRSNREMRQQEEAERRAQAEQRGGGPTAPRQADKDFTQEAPNVSDIAKVFGSMGL